MFTTTQQLKKKTPEQGIGRKEYIEHLVEEFHISTDVGNVTLRFFLLSFVIY